MADERHVQATVQRELDHVKVLQAQISRLEATVRSRDRQVEEQRERMKRLEEGRNEALELTGELEAETRRLAAALTRVEKRLEHSERLRVVLSGENAKLCGRVGKLEQERGTWKEAKEQRGQRAVILEKQLDSTLADLTAREREVAALKQQLMLREEDYKRVKRQVDNKTGTEVAAAYSSMLEQIREEQAKAQASVEERIARANDEVQDVHEEASATLARAQARLREVEERERQAQEELARVEKQRDAAQRAADIARSKQEKVNGRCSLLFAELFSLRVTIVDARDLIDPDEPRMLYVALKVNKTTRRTQPRNYKRTQWEQRFGFITETKPRVLQVSVREDKEAGGSGKAAFLGEASLPLGDLFDSVPKKQGTAVFEGELPLNKVASGVVTVRVECQRIPQTTLRWVSGYFGSERDPYAGMDIAKVLDFARCNLEAKERGNGRTPLLDVAAANSALGVRTLFASGANLEATDPKGNTALILASFFGFTPTVRELLGCGANVHAANQKQLTSLMVAAKKGRLDVIKLLLRADARVSDVDATGSTALHLATIEGHDEAVDALLEAGANAETLNNDGMSPLMLAVNHQHRSVVRTLLQRGANVQGRDNRNLTALMLATMNANPDIVQDLVRAHAQVDAAESHGRTALMIAAQLGHLDVARVLLESQADPLAADQDGLTPTDIALSHNRGRVASLLHEWVEQHKVWQQWKHRVKKANVKLERQMSAVGRD